MSAGERVPTKATAPFTAQLRARPGTIALGAPGAADVWTVRVQVSEVYDAVRLTAPRGESVLAVKVAALAELMPEVAYHDDFVVKLHGVEVHDESASLADVGASDGSIFLVMHRRRRPVR